MGAGRKELQHLGLWRVSLSFLLEMNILQCLDQANVLGEPAPGNQKSMLSVLNMCFFFTGSRSRKY